MLEMFKGWHHATRACSGTRHGQCWEKLKAIRQLTQARNPLTNTEAKIMCFGMSSGSFVNSCTHTIHMGSPIAHKPYIWKARLPFHLRMHAYILSWRPHCLPLIRYIYKYAQIYKCIYIYIYVYTYAYFDSNQWLAPSPSHNHLVTISRSLQ